MPEVLDVRELGDDGDGDNEDLLAPAPGPPSTEASSTGAAAPRPGPWRRRTGMAVVALLGLSVLYMLTVGRPASTAPEPAPTKPATPVEAAARAALDAWAGFASTGDVAPLAESFHPAGPQLARLRAEASAVAARASSERPYTFSATALRPAPASGDEQLVAADVVVSRPGEADQRFAWELVMRRSGGQGRWVLWTVRDRSAGPASTTAGRTP